MSDVLAVRAVTFIREATPILSDIDLTVRSGEHWALLGPNGAGKSSLLNICAAVTFPSRGHVEILGHQLGQIDLRELRRSIGFVNPRHPLRSNLSGEDIILTGATGSIELVPRWEPTDDQRDHARYLMKSLGLGPGLYWHTMSQGERGRALIARALMTDPPLLLMDEPSTGLDLAAREQMIQTLTQLSTSGITTVTVTHHFEELPPSTTHAALIRNGKITAHGPVESVLTSEHVSQCYDHPIRISRERGRWHATA